MEHESSLDQDGGASPLRVATGYSHKKAENNKQMACGKWSQNWCTDDSRMPICPYFTRDEECSNHQHCLARDEVAQECFM